MGDRIVIDGLALARRHFTVEEFHRMGETGILTSDDRVELIRGEILQMTPIGSTHSGCVAYLTNTFAARLGGRVIVNPQNPVRLARDTEPQPDLVLLKPRPDFYRLSHPTVHEVLLLVEVADSSIKFDRDVKQPIYAQDGIPEVWIVNLGERRIHVYRDLAQGQYRDIFDVTGTGRLHPLVFPDCELAADEILG